jgi:hypothetical protein
MGCCCGKSAQDDALIPATDTKKNERVIISSRSPSSASNKNASTVGEEYEPPSFPDPEFTQRLSLPISPAQKGGKKISITKHRKKAGFVKKKGHLVKNWKRRYLVLKGLFLRLRTLPNFDYTYVQ